MVSNGYWFYFEPYAYVKFVEPKLLVYNTLDGNYIEYRIDSIVFEVILSKIRRCKNQPIFISSKNFILPAIQHFIKILRKIFVADFLQSENSNNKPVKINHDVFIIKNAIKDIHFIGSSSDILLSEIFEITFYINDKQIRDIYALNYPNGKYQFKFPIYNKKVEELKIETLTEIINDKQLSNLKIINIIGGDIFNYYQVEKLITLINDSEKYYNFYFHYTEIYENLIYLNKNYLYKNNYLFNIIITYPVNIQKLEAILNSDKNKNIFLKIIFIVCNENELLQASKFINIPGIKSFSILPYYNDCNILFLKKYFYFKRKKVLEKRKDFHDLIQNRLLNYNNYGKFVVLSNGDVKTNLNADAIGNIYRNSMKNLIYRAIKKDKLWYLTRDNVAPCNICNYALFCPPISNYELFLNRNNLCKKL